MSTTALHALLLHNQKMLSTQRAHHLSKVASHIVTFTSHHNYRIINTTLASIVTSPSHTKHRSLHYWSPSFFESLILTHIIILWRVMVRVYIHKCYHAIKFLRDLSSHINLLNMVFLIPYVDIGMLILLLLLLLMILG